MSFSPKNAERALRAVGLDQPGPIHAADKAARLAHACRLAEFWDRMETLDLLDADKLPPLRPFNPKIG